jgi:NAD-dependent DNA ligase
MFIENKYDRYVVARWAYLMGEPIISDIEYDKLEKEFRLDYPDDSHSNRPWSFDECPVELLKKYGYSEMICNPTMGYMAESIYSINNQEEFERTFRNLNEKSRLSFKIDGWNTRVSYFNGHIVNVETRGRSGTNLDIKNVAKLFPKEIPIKGRVAVTGEMSIPNDKWDIFKSMTDNKDQRASVRSAIARDAVDFLAFLAFNIFIENGVETGDQYVLLNQLGFTSPKFVWVNNFEELKKNIWYMSYINKAYNYLTDGLVIENGHYQYAIRLGAWEEHAMHSFVEGYEENQGMYGNYLKVKCYPISVEGKTFPRISINNIASIIENNLQIGYPIAFNLRSSANVVIDSAETDALQKQWAGRYEQYRDNIRKGK